MDNAQLNFRFENKYYIDQGQASILSATLSGALKKDPHLKGEAYHVRSLYFDDYCHSCFYENENGTDPREKFRIRIYDCRDRFIRLELKQKQRQMTRKLQCRLSRDQFDRILRGEALENFSELPPLMRKFELERKTRLLAPAVIVDYYRIPYICKTGNVRVTMDYGIAASDRFSQFFEENMPKKTVVKEAAVVLEVKYDDILPGYIERLLNTGDMRKTTFSKYYTCMKYGLGM